MFLRKFHDGLMLGTTMSAAGAVDTGGGGGGGDDAARTAFVSSLPEPVRAHDAFKDIGDVGTLATRYHAEATKPFLERLDEKYRKEPALKDFKDPNALAQSFLDTQRMVGADKAKFVAIPKDETDTKAWNDFYAAQGRPESADKYVVPKRADGKDYGAEDVALQKAMLPALHEAGLSQRQIDKLIPKWNEVVGGMLSSGEAASAAAMESASKALKTELGAAYDEKLGLATDAIKHYAGELKLGDAIVKDMEDAKLGNHPGLFKLLAHIGAQLKEDGLLGKGGGGGAGALDPAAAKAAIKVKEADAEFMKKYNAEKGAPGRDEAIAEMKALFDQAYPEQKPE
jgi:hypothetical protein